MASGNEGAQTVTVTTSGTVIYSVSTVADAADEPNGPVTVTVTGSTAYTVDSSQNSASVTINDDDVTPAAVTVTETNGGTTPTEGGTDQYTMVLTTQPTANVTIMATSGTPATATINPSSLIFTSANWSTAPDHHRLRGE